MFAHVICLSGARGPRRLRWPTLSESDAREHESAFKPVSPPPQNDVTFAMSTSQPIHGNYHGYYSKRPSPQDPRLALLPADLFRDACVLDVGCNEGYVTCQIGQSWGARRVVGVDIDETLIRAAWKRRRTMWSLQGPTDGWSNQDYSVQHDRKRQKTEREGEDNRGVPDYFPASCEHMSGPLPIPPDASNAQRFPHNVLFQTADWVNSETAEDAHGYDVIVAFSISKWIHLNGGDAGLKRFFQRVYAVLRPGGAFVFEPQEWETYAKAKRMDASLRENAKDLKIHPSDFESILVSIGFTAAEHLGRTGEGGFRRPVDLYRKHT